jgi:hypothetical protein
MFPPIRGERDRNPQFSEKCAVEKVGKDQFRVETGQQLDGGMGRATIASMCDRGMRER